jgi:hypothetical protein
MFIVRGIETRSVPFACRTHKQALEKVLELLGTGFQVTIDDASGRCWTSDEFLRVAVDGTKQGPSAPQSFSHALRRSSK